MKAVTAVDFYFLLTKFGLLILVKTRQSKKKNTNKKQKTMIHHLISPEALKRIKNLWRFRRCVRNKKLHHATNAEICPRAQ